MDQRTNRWFSSQLSGTTSLAASTDDDGANWLPSEGGPLNGGVDHQTFGGGPYAAPLTGGLVFPDAVYYCSQDLVAALCARSDTGGTTFNPAVPIYTDQCGGLHGHVQVSADGTVYVPNKNCGGAQGVVASDRQRTDVDRAHGPRLDERRLGPVRRDRSEQHRLPRLRRR